MVVVICRVRTGSYLSVINTPIPYWLLPKIPEHCRSKSVRYNFLFQLAAVMSVAVPHHHQRKCIIPPQGFDFGSTSLASLQDAFRWLATEWHRSPPHITIHDASFITPPFARGVKDRQKHPPLAVFIVYTTAGVWYRSQPSVFRRSGYHLWC